MLLDLSGKESAFNWDEQQVNKFLQTGGECKRRFHFLKCVNIASMITFLDQLAHQFVSTDLNRACFVFPTRRAAYIFKRSLINHSSKTLLLPDIFGIRDFISTVSPLPIAEPLPLLLTLYNVYSKHDKNLPLEKFIPWGEIILHDFNEIDLQLINAKKLFQRIYDLKAIEEEFSIEEEERKQVAEFWQLFSNKEITPLQQTFLSNWEILPKVYDEFKQSLLEKKFIYEGMAYRSLAENPQQHSQLIYWDKIVFAGFYALSNAEEKIISYLQAQNKAEVFWDVDEYYFDDKNQEAGKYLRKNKLLDKDFKWKSDSFNSIPKNIYITGAPLLEAQAKWLGVQLEIDLKKPGFKPQATAIVLPDEQLLIPVLNALPPQLKELNVTMGYPVKQNSIYSLLMLYLQLHSTSKESNAADTFFRSQLQVLIQHPLVKTKDAALINLINGSDSLYLSASSLTTHDQLLQLFFKPVKMPADLTAALISIAELISRKEEESFNRQAAEFVLDELTKFNVHILPYYPGLNETVVIRLLSDFLRTLRISFTGEPLTGVQIMGFLETRVLDFERVYILSMNEDQLPKASRSNSYIPYSLRKSFGLPVQEDQDAVYAYHFYRLLQRSNEIHLIYNTEVKSPAGREKSRYLLQLAMEAEKKSNGNVRVHYQDVNLPVHAIKEAPIEIKKSEDILALMSARYLTKGNDAKGFSPTALIDYNWCTLRFYYKHIAGIREPLEDKTELSQDVFGNIFHEAMRMLYNEQTILEPSGFKSLKEKINEKADAALLKIFKRKITGGNDYLLFGIIKELLSKILLTDEKELPVKIISLEQEYSAELNVPGTGNILLRGKLDRVDEKEGIVRIIDYKTGSYKIGGKELMENIFRELDYKAGFQLMFYALMWKKNFPDAKIKSGIYPLKKTSKGIDFIYGDVIDDYMLQVFEEKLLALIKDIFNSSISFLKTEKIKRCRICEFKNICQR